VPANGFHPSLSRSTHFSIFQNFGQWFFAIFVLIFYFCFEKLHFSKIFLPCFENLHNSLGLHRFT